MRCRRQHFSPARPLQSPLDPLTQLTRTRTRWGGWDVRRARARTCCPRWMDRSGRRKECGPTSDLCRLRLRLRRRRQNDVRWQQRSGKTTQLKAGEGAAVFWTLGDTASGSSVGFSVLQCPKGLWVVLVLSMGRRDGETDDRHITISDEESSDRRRRRPRVRTDGGRVSPVSPAAAFAPRPRPLLVPEVLTAASLPHGRTA